MINILYVYISVLEFVAKMAKIYLFIVLLWLKLAKPQQNGKNLIDKNNFISFIF